MVVLLLGHEPRTEVPLLLVEATTSLLPQEVYLCLHCGALTRRLSVGCLEGIVELLQALDFFGGDGLLSDQLVNPPEGGVELSCQLVYTNQQPEVFVGRFEGGGGGVGGGDGGVGGGKNFLLDQLVNSPDEPQLGVGSGTGGGGGSTDLLGQSGIEGGHFRGKLPFNGGDLGSEQPGARGNTEENTEQKRGDAIPR